MNAAGIWATFRFESKRALQPARLAWWIGLVIFPVFLIAVIAAQAKKFDTFAATMTLFYLLPRVLCPIGLLLWAPSALQAELESKTWAYLALRPHGKTSMLLGKYAVAVFWTVTAAWVGLSLSLLILRPEQGLRLGVVLGGLSLLSVLAYGALFLFLGVLIPRRAMAIAVLYTLLLEFILAFVPAMINQLTVAYHLRNLLFAGMGWTAGAGGKVSAASFRAFSPLLGQAPSWQHLLFFALYLLLFLSAARALLQRKELTTADEN